MQRTSYRKQLVLVLAIWLGLSSNVWADISWWVGPYDRKDRPNQPGRVCSADRYTPQVHAEGGEWREVEILGNRCIFKLRSSAAVIAIYAADNDFRRLPKNSLDTLLSDLTNPQKTALRNFVLGLGYTSKEINQALPNNLGTYTLRDVVRFIIKRRHNIIYNPATNTIEEGVEDLPGYNAEDMEFAVQ